MTVRIIYPCKNCGMKGKYCDKLILDSNGRKFCCEKCSHTVRIKGL